MPKKNDPHTIRASLVLAAIEEFGHRQQLMAEVLGTHTVKLQKLDKIEEDIVCIKQDLDIVKKQSTKHDRALKTHTEIMATQTTTLGKHSKILGENSHDLKDLKSDMKIVKEKLSQTVHRADHEDLERRVTIIESKTY